MVVEPLRPARGGFLRPFGCGWFIREFLIGHGPNGSPRIDPEVVLLPLIVRRHQRHYLVGGW